MKIKIICILICIILAAIMIPATSRETSKDNKNYNDTIEDVDWWPMLGHDPQHTGFSTSIAPNTNMVKWNYDAGSEVRFSSPVIMNDKLYMGTMGISAKNLHDFYEIKDKSVLENFFENKEKNSVESGCVFCIDTETGDKLWEFITKGKVSSTPVVYNGFVYVLTSDSYTYEGELYCLNAETGIKQWNLTFTNLQTTPVIEDDNLFVAIADPISEEGKLVCLDPVDGLEKWSHSMGLNNLAMFSAPAVYDDKVYLVSLKLSDVNLYCFDVTTGQEEWHSFLTTMELGLAVSSPIISEDKVYVMSLEAYYSNQTVRSVLICMDAESGDDLWRYRMADLDISLATPVVANNIIYFSYAQNYWEYGGIACVDANTGEIIWDQRSYNDFFTFSSPAVADEKLYICSMNEFSYECNLICFDINSGEKIWTYMLSDIWMIDISPAIADEMVFAISPYGNVFAFEDELKISEISGGLASVNLEIENSGDSDFTDIDWSISVTGGILNLINISKNDTIALLESQSTDNVRAFPVFGLGKINISATLSMEGINTIKMSKEGFVLGFIVMIN